MGILNNVVVAFPDTIVIATTPKGVITDTGSAPTTVEDIWLAVVIGIIVISGLWIIGYHISKSVISAQNNKLAELESRQSHELAKLNKEAEIRAAAELRVWSSEEAKLKIEDKRLNLKLREAETNSKIRSFEKEGVLGAEQIQS